MKITDVALFRVHGRWSGPVYPPGERQARPIDLYPELNTPAGPGYQTGAAIHALPAHRLLLVAKWLHLASGARHGPGALDRTKGIYSAPWQFDRHFSRRSASPDHKRTSKYDKCRSSLIQPE
jgi:hypothetical protein